MAGIFDILPMAGLDPKALGGAFPSAPSPASTGQNAFQAARMGVAPTAPMPQRPTMFAGGDGIMGLISRLSGNPTRDEFAQKEQGGARAAGLQQFQQIMAQGKNPQEALLELINTPQGQNMLANDPDALRQMVTAASAVTPAAGPDPVKLGAGDALFSAGGQEIARNAPTAVQEFTAMAEIASLPDEMIQEMAKAKIADAQTGDKTQQERAVSRMIADGFITPEAGDRLLAGTIEVTTIRDATGAVIGNGILDRINGETKMIGGGGPDGMRAPVQPGTPEYAPGLNDDTTPEMDADGGVPADVVFGAGAVPMAGTFLGGILGQAFPELAGREHAKNRNHLKKIRADMQNYRSLIGEDRSFAADAKLIDDIADFTGATAQVGQTYDAMLQLHDFIDQAMQRDVVLYNDPTAPGKARGNAFDRIQSLKRMQKSLPTRQALNAIGEKVGEYSAVNEAVEGVGNAERVMTRDTPGMVDKAGEVIPGGPLPPATPTEQPQVHKYSTIEEVEAAFDAGEIKFGDVVDLNGNVQVIRDPREKKGTK